MTTSFSPSSTNPTFISNLKSKTLQRTKPSSQENTNILETFTIGRPKTSRESTNSTYPFPNSISLPSCTDSALFATRNSFMHLGSSPFGENNDIQSNHSLENSCTLVNKRSREEFEMDCDDDNDRPAETFGTKVEEDKKMALQLKRRKKSHTIYSIHPFQRQKHQTQNNSHCLNSTTTTTTTRTSTVTTTTTTTSTASTTKLQGVDMANSEKSSHTGLEKMNDSQSRNQLPMRSLQELTTNKFPDSEYQSTQTNGSLLVEKFGPYTHSNQRIQSISSPSENSGTNVQNLGKPPYFQQQQYEYIARHQLRHHLLRQTHHQSCSDDQQRRGNDCTSDHYKNINSLLFQIHNEKRRSHS